MDAVNRTVTVSERTLRFLECKNAVDDVYAMFQSLMGEMYLPEENNKITEGEFLDMTLKMQEFIEHYMCRNIEMNIGSYKNFTEI